MENGIMENGNISPVHYKLDFLKLRYVCFSISIFLLVAGAFLYFLRGGFAYHIDFTGGIEIRVSFEKAIKVSEIRHSIASHGLPNSVIQEIGSNNKTFIIRIRNTENKVENQIKSALTKSFTDNKTTVENVEWVGAEVGEDTKWNAIKAVLLSLVLLLLYIAIRSEFSFAIGAIAALIHDVLIVLCFLLLTGEQISLHILAAVLAVLGYSLNDTIVIFSKIRENLKKLQGVSLYEIINMSINQTLRRTILTSVSTFLSILAILILGGIALRGLSLVFALGVVVGTYSSIYIASAGMLFVKKSIGTK
jgi:preprotein translocase subunit SecF